MIDKTCRTCIDNEDGFCDRKGILVDDEDSCEKHREDWRDRFTGSFSQRSRKGEIMWGTLLLGHCVSSVDLQWGCS